MAQNHDHDWEDVTEEPPLPGNGDKIVTVACKDPECDGTMPVTLHDPNMGGR